MASGGQQAMNRQHIEIGHVVCVLDGTSTFTDDTRSIVTIQRISLALYWLRPVAALLVHLVQLAHLYPQYVLNAYLHVYSSGRTIC